VLQVHKSILIVLLYITHYGHRKVKQYLAFSTYFNTDLVNNTAADKGFRRPRPE